MKLKCGLTGSYFAHVLGSNFGAQVLRGARGCGIRVEGSKFGNPHPYP